MRKQAWGFGNWEQQLLDTNAWLSSYVNDVLDLDDDMKYCPKVHMLGTTGTLGWAGTVKNCVEESTVAMTCPSM